MDIDIYGPSKVVEPSNKGLVNGKPSKQTRTVIQLSLCDSLPAYGPIADVTFSLARNGVCLFPSVEALVVYVFPLFEGSSRTGTCCSNWCRLSRRIHIIPGLSGDTSLSLSLLISFFLTARSAHTHEAQAACDRWCTRNVVITHPAARQIERSCL